MFIVMSMKVLWKFRKMGDTWEKDGRPNPKPVVYNPGGPMFVFGWFLFWIGMSSSTQGVLENGIEPIVTLYHWVHPKTVRSMTELKVVPLCRQACLSSNR